MNENEEIVAQIFSFLIIKDSSEGSLPLLFSFLRMDLALHFASLMLNTLCILIMFVSSV